MNPSPLLSLDEALKRLLEKAIPLADTHVVSTFEADGCVLAQDLVSDLQVPAFDNSAMDGYALRTADLNSNQGILKVGLRILAGHAPPLCRQKKWPEFSPEHLFLSGLMLL
jgi:molybdopterin molybdotransferase